MTFGLDLEEKAGLDTWPAEPGRGGVGGRRKQGLPQPGLPRCGSGLEFSAWGRPAGASVRKVDEGHSEVALVCRGWEFSIVLEHPFPGCFTSKGS